jgi:signal transduction histidine kinase/ActR/RegA family two-component response regulator
MKAKRRIQLFTLLGVITLLSTSAFLNQSNFINLLLAILLLIIGYTSALIVQSVQRTRHLAYKKSLLKNSGEALSLESLPLPAALFDTSWRCLRANELFYRAILNRAEGILPHGREIFGPQLFEELISKSRDVLDFTTYSFQVSLKHEGGTKSYRLICKRTDSNIGTPELLTLLQEEAHATLLNSADNPLSDELPLQRYIGALEQAQGEIKSKRKQLELQQQELFNLKDEIVQMSTARSGFIATISHELRTPMNGIIGILELLGEHTLTPEQTSLIETARSSAQELVRLVSDILDLSKIEGDKLELAPKAFLPAELLNTVRTFLEPLADKKSITLHAAANLPSEIYYLGDEFRIRQILTNLAGNAIKFCPEGGHVVIGCALAQDQSSTKCTAITFFVSDTGNGIPQESLERIFEAFAQANAYISSQYGGTGLGLNISQKLARLMGGSTAVQSTQGIGTCFHVTLPLTITEAPTPVKMVSIEAQMALEGKRILVVDDNALNRTIASRLLTKRGYICEEAENGQEALHKLEHASFDLALVDCEMPIIDGYEFTKLVRAHTLFKELPIVAMTGHVDDAHREHCFAIGMSGYTTKPILKEALFNEIARLLTTI